MDLKGLRRLPAVCSITSAVVHSIPKSAKRHLLLPANMVNDAVIIPYKRYSIAICNADTDDHMAVNHSGSCLRRKVKEVY